ncbi:Uncharacterized protein OBRU01_04631 [Operophtera brumata]|uniref:MADF domain-containing protein n=1 Tax=Operophtera brumata TaxID=104452 RepID=A0A0L7LNP3_OPEBR|nr:Uncharacterized protein OBRU01_04631 [Operophtera brumata]
MEPILETFYFECLLPEIIDGRIPRNLARLFIRSYLSGRIDNPRGYRHSIAKNEFARLPLGSIYLTYQERVQLLRGRRAYRTVTIDRFDTELFIDEVEKRPALWDIQLAEYSNKIIRNGAWQELVEIFGENEDSLEKKALFDSDFCSRCNIKIRDAYNKEFKKGKSIPSGSGACKGSICMYFNRLSFLQKTVENKETTSNIDKAKNERIQNIDQKQDNFLNARDIQPVRNKRKKTKITSEERLADILENSIESTDKIQRQIQESMSKPDDDDKLFCMSLYKELKKGPRK